MLSSSTFQISAQHPCLAGHFPKHPIVPGVVLLEQVEALVLTQLPGWQISELSHVKFIGKVLSEEIIEVQINLEKLETQQSVAFKLINQTKQIQVATGKFKLSLV